MTYDRAKTEFPGWAMAPLPPEVPKTKQKAGPVIPESVKRFGRDFFRRYGIMIIVVLAFLIYGWIVKVHTEKVTTERVTQEVTSELRRGFQAELERLEQERRAEQFLTGDESFEAAVEEISVPMSQIIATYAMDYGISSEGLRSIGWVFCARLARNTTEFGRTPQEILEKSEAWEGKVVGHATRSQDLELAREIARDYLNGVYPDNFNTNLTFFNREAGGKIIARNELYTGPYTQYWWYGK